MLKGKFFSSQLLDRSGKVDMNSKLLFLLLKGWKGRNPFYWTPQKMSKILNISRDIRRCCFYLGSLFVVLLTVDAQKVSSVDSSPLQPSDTRWTLSFNSSSLTLSLPTPFFIPLPSLFVPNERPKLDPVYGNRTIFHSTGLDSGLGHQDSSSSVTGLSSLFTLITFTTCTLVFPVFYVQVLSKTFSVSTPEELTLTDNFLRISTKSIVRKSVFVMRLFVSSRDLTWLHCQTIDEKEWGENRLVRAKRFVSDSIKIFYFSIKWGTNLYSVNLL